MIFPDGVEVNLETLGFGTLNISLLYSVVATKKDSNEPFLTLLVEHKGLKPLTSSMRMMRSIS